MWLKRREHLQCRYRYPKNLVYKMALKFVCVEDYEKHAAKVLPSYALEYYKSGADEEQTLRENRDSFKR